MRQRTRAPTSPARRVPGTTITLDAGAYNVTETGPSRLHASHSAADCSGTIAAGGSATCTVTNDDQAAKLTVIKHVINDNGGTASRRLHARLGRHRTTRRMTSPARSRPARASPSTRAAYDVTETGPSGYTASYSADCSGSIANGETKTCTVTNDDQAREADRDQARDQRQRRHGDAATSRLTRVGRTTRPDDFAGAESPGTEVTPRRRQPTTVTETGPSGYTASYSADCSGTIAIGETKTCTVTNDDQAAKLTVIKHVINDNGGTASRPTSRSTRAATNDTPDDFAGAESPGTTVTLDAGAYDVTETGPSGYTASYSADCAGTIAIGETKTCTVTNDDQAREADRDQARDQRQRRHGVGGRLHARRRRHRRHARLTSPARSRPGTDGDARRRRLQRHRDRPVRLHGELLGRLLGHDRHRRDEDLHGHQRRPGGEADRDQARDQRQRRHGVAGDFTLDRAAPNDTPDDFAGAETPGTTSPSTRAPTTSPRAGRPATRRATRPTARASIANRRDEDLHGHQQRHRAELTVIKHVINDNGGTATASDFTMNVTATNPSSSSFAGAQSPGTTITVNAGQLQRR